MEISGGRIMQNFIGKDGFNWWMGVVEDINDPLMIGRARVRIFGWHSENLQEMPTNELPWTVPVNSPNTSKSVAPPRVNDYVVGFFTDGQSAQSPVMLGVFPGLEPTSVDTAKGFSPQTNMVSAQPPSGQVIYVPGQPTTPPTSRQVVSGTPIEKSNNELAHVCDFITELQKNNLLKKFLVAQAGAIRDAIRAVMRALGFSDATGANQWAIDKFKTITRELKRIQKEIIQPVLDFEKIAVQYIKKLQDIINWILSLPAKLYALLKDCLENLYKLVKNVLNDVIDAANPFEDSGFSDVMSAAKETVQTVGQTVSLAATAAGNAAAISTVATSTVDNISNLKKGI